MKRSRFSAVIAAVLVPVLTLTACGSDSGPAASTTSSAVDDPSSQAPSSQVVSSEAGTSAPASSATGGPVDTSAAEAELTGTLTIYAAASLKTTFDELRTQFQAEHPDLDFPEITYDGSSVLVTQLTEGAQADIFASADTNNMTKAVDADLVAGTPVDFATNTLEIAVAPGNPKGITGLADLAGPEIVTVLCQAEVPCGNASKKVLEAAGVTVTPSSEEQNVTAVRTKVETGEADAGLIYKTDVNSAAGKVEGVEFPEAADAVNRYPIAVLSRSANAEAAQAFLDLVTGAQGQQVLTDAGFGAP